VIDPNTNPATYYATAVGNSEGGAQQNSPKRQRTGNEGGESVAGGNVDRIVSDATGRGGNTQSSHQRDMNFDSRKGKEVVVSSTSISDDLSDCFSKKIRNL
jgi:hypothetical protein